MDEGNIASFLVENLGLALAPKMCPDQSQAFKEINNSQAFTVVFFCGFTDHLKELLDKMRPPAPKQEGLARDIPPR